MKKYNLITPQSQSCQKQDLFAFYINNYSTNGYFLDFASAEPYNCNNSIFFERIGWKGIAADYDERLVNEFRQARPNTPCLLANLKEKSVAEIMKEFDSPNIIDYFSLDLDGGAALPCIKSFDFKNSKIRCITFEHDFYREGEQMRRESREFLSSVGMKMICSDVCFLEGHSFEDWWINPELVSKEIYEPLICCGLHFQKIIDKIYN